MKEGSESLTKSYVSKLLSNIVALAINLSINILIPRVLGPSAYGNYGFLKDFFQKVFDLFDSGASIGFYVKLSKGHDPTGLKAFFWNYVFLLSIIVFALVGLAALFELESHIWGEIEAYHVWLGAILGLGTYTSTVSLKIIDAHRLTSKGETIRILHKFFGLCLIAIFYLYGCLNLELLFISTSLSLFTTVIHWDYLLKRVKYSLGLWSIPTKPQIVQYVVEFRNFISPLFIYSAAGALAAILERWMLQIFAGSEEQGYYTLAFQISTICLLFTAALLPLFTREISKMHSTGNLKKTSVFLLKNIPLFFAITSFISIFAATQTEAILNLVGGQDYADAKWPLALMCLYPIHQTYGQLNGSVFYATERTPSYRNIGLATISIGLIATLLLLSPNRWGSPGLGSLGLSIKMIAVQLIGVNVLLWANCRYFRISFSLLLWKQFAALTTLGLAALLAKTAAKAITSDWYAFFASGFFYSLTAGTILYTFPSIAGIERAELIHFLSKIRHFKNRKD